MQVEKKAVFQAVDIFGKTLEVFECKTKAYNYTMSAAYNPVFFGGVYQRDALVCPETGDIYLVSGPYKGEDAKAKKAAAARESALAKLTSEERAALGL